MKAFIFCFFVCFFLLIFEGVGQELPPIKNFSPQEYAAENQNWMLCQAKNKFIYAANNAGLLEFNGENWTLYDSPNHSIIRSVNCINNKVYVGLYMDFGFYEADERGILQYSSLQSKLGFKLKEDEQIWNIVAYEDWILFQSFNSIYFYNVKDESFKSLSSSKNITKLFKVSNTIYFHVVNEGIYSLENGKKRLLVKAEDFKNDLVINIFENQNSLVFLTRNNGFFEINDAGAKASKLASEVLQGVSIYSSVQLQDGTILLGTIASGLIQISPNGEVLLNIDQEKGLHNNTVLTMLEDNDNNVWLGLDNGIDCVNLKSPVTIYYDDKGVLGTVYASQIFENNLYLGTNHGVFYKPLNTNSDFKFVEGTDGQVLCLEVFNETLLCGHDLGTFEIKNGIANRVSAIGGSWQIKPVPIENSKLLIQGNYNGLHVLEFNDGHWHVRNKIDGFDISTRFFEFSEPNTVWVNHEYKGVYKLEIDEAFYKVTHLETSKVLSQAKSSSLAKFRNQVLYASSNGIFKYDSHLGDFKKDSLLSSLFLKDDYVSGKLIPVKSDKLWFFTKHNINYFYPNSIDNHLEIKSIAIPVALRKTMVSYENVFSLKNEHYLLGTTNGYLRLNLLKVTEEHNRVTINAVALGEKNSALEALPVYPEAVESFNYKQNNLKISYSIPDFDKFMMSRYQYQLIPGYEEWSELSDKNTVFFENLPHGDYTFNVRAVVSNTLTNKASYSFKINRPWYISNWALAVYFVGFLMILFVIDSYSRKKYKKQKADLIKRNEKKLELINLENEQKLMALNNKQLRKDIESKNNELAIATMSLIKKNELLSSLKKDLLEINKEAELKPVIKNIDKNINNTKDWDFFQEAFNNADKDFLKKIHKLHPKLTPNDLKFCAYLRLNLTSKEIAPLLNISVRSVEIKRYRLRKKMNLSHEKSLVEYILEV